MPQPVYLYKMCEKRRAYSQQQKFSELLINVESQDETSCCHYMYCNVYKFLSSYCLTISSHTSSWCQSFLPSSSSSLCLVLHWLTICSTLCFMSASALLLSTLPILCSAELMALVLVLLVSTVICMPNFQGYTCSYINYTTFCILALSIQQWVALKHGLNRLSATSRGPSSHAIMTFPHRASITLSLATVGVIIMVVLWEAIMTLHFIQLICHIICS